MPVGATLWAFGEFATRSEREKTDAHLNAVLGAAVAELGAAAEDAERTAIALATSPRVQRALGDRDRAALGRLRRTHPNAAFSVDRTFFVGETRRPALQRGVDVVLGREGRARVDVSVPLNDALLARLARESRLPRSDLLLLLDGGRVVAVPRAIEGVVHEVPDGRGDVRLGGSTYRAAATRPLPRAPDLKLAALRPASSIEASIDDVQRRILLAAVAALAALAVAAYAGAPAFARGRLSLKQRAQAGRVLSNLGDGVFLVDSSGVIRFSNPAAEAITGLPAREVWDRKAADVIPGWERIARLGRARRDPGAAETIPVDVRGSERWLSFSAVDLPDGTVYTFRDLTEERRLEEAKTDFVATVSHELRTPLAAVYGAALTLRRGDSDLDEMRREALLQMIVEQCDRLAHIVDEILLARALLPGRLGVDDDSFDGAEVARDVVETVRPRLPRRLSLELVTPPAAAPVMAEREKTRQVLVNLIENAIKYSPGGGRIEVGLEPAGRRVRFWVRDEGLGIPPSEHERIFDKFYRLDPNLTRGTGGIGLGLYIARELVRNMNGRMWVESETGAGSTFFFELPSPGEIAG